MLNLGIILFIILLALSLIILYNLLFASTCDKINSKTEHFVDAPPVQNPQWSRTECKYIVGDTLQKVMNENNITQASANKEGNSGTLQLTCGYDEIDNEINKLQPVDNQRIFIVHNADHVSAKDYLWNRLVTAAGIDRAKTIMPNTYILKSPDDRERLKKDFKPGNLYIMKKNIQRQEGLKIIDSLDDMLNASNISSGFVLAQELLQNPYTINVSKDNVPDNRKINMRFYILVVCKEKNMDVYVFDDGFMYYTKESFKMGSKDIGPNVTTGYIDRWVYEQNPLTHSDFRNYLDKTDRPLTQTEQNIRDQGLRISSVVFSRIYNLLRETFTCIIGKVCEGEKLSSNVSFQLFGADIAVSDQLWSMVMEVNKGPDMSAKDDKDGFVKRKCTADMLRIVGLVEKNNNNGFIQIINKEGDSLLPVNL